MATYFLFIILIITSLSDNSIISLERPLSYRLRLWEPLAVFGGFSIMNRNILHPVNQKYTNQFKTILYTVWYGIKGKGKYSSKCGRKRN